MVKTPASNVRDVVLIPGQGTKIPNAIGQLSPWTGTTEPICSRDRMPELDSLPAATRENHTPQTRGSWSRAMKSLCTRVKTQCR